MVCICLASPVSKHDVLLGGRSVLCLQGAPESPNQEQSSAQSDSGNSSNSSSTSDASLQMSSKHNQVTFDFDQEIVHLNQDSPLPGLSVPMPVKLKIRFSSFCMGQNRKLILFFLFFLMTHR